MSAEKDAEPQGVLAVTDLTVDYSSRAGVVHAVRGVSLSVRPSTKLGIVGESGSGKSTLALAVLDLIDPPGRIVRGEVRLDGKRVPLGSDLRMSALRGREISLVYQDPLSALDPVKPIGFHVLEAVKRHQHQLGRHAARERALDLLNEVGIGDARRRFRDYPHQFSGGMLQRVMIAGALANDPRVVIADEPTTALDRTTQAQILNLLERLVGKRGSSVVLITHDLGIVADFCDEAAVMYAGRIVEHTSAKLLSERAVHPYTAALMASVPRAGTSASEPLHPIRGLPPDLRSEWSGCSFQPRCALAAEICLTEPPVPARTVRYKGFDIEAECHFADRPVERSGVPAIHEPARRFAAPSMGEAGTHPIETLLQVEDLQMRFRARKKFPWDPDSFVQAVNGVSFRIGAGEALGLVGETGCGKSTIGRCVIRLLQPSAGTVYFDGTDILALDGTELRRMRSRMQIVFQDTYGSLDPRMSVEALVEEPLIIHGERDGTSRRARVNQLLGLVGLTARHGRQTIHGLSGGQRQRVAIARALVLNPDFVVLDEPLSALDVSIQGQIMNLLKELQAELSLSYLFVAHDLIAAEYVCQRVAVLYLGEIVETAYSNPLFTKPLHPYTAALLWAAPSGASGGERGHGVLLAGEVTHSALSTPGCPFEPRCPVGRGREVCQSV